ncbi:MAG: DUF6090 family protein [Flavobacteriaceae bacterium]|nr:hypothetical protein [Flavobacteriaceae bacterium]
MIKFFRKIRHGLMNENKMGKYFKYAIGEILLVVIGILIALGVNNWNEKRKEKNKEVVYLNRLMSNLSYDVSLYKQIMQRDSLLLESMTNLEDGLTSNVLLDKENITELVTGYRFTSNKTTIDNLISSGQIEVLRSHYLVEKIFMYYRTVENIDNGTDEAISNNNRNTFGPLIINSGYFKNSEIDLYTLKKDTSLLTSIRFKKFLLDNQLKLYNGQYQLAQELIEDIRNELNYID